MKTDLSNYRKSYESELLSLAFPRGLEPFFFFNPWFHETEEFGGVEEVVP
jgi:pyridoxamine 5'-phosphate oxidase